MDDPEGSEEQHEEMLAVDGQTGHQDVHRLHLVSLVLHLDDVEDGGLVLGTKDAPGDLPEELLHHAGDGVEGIVLNVDEAALQRKCPPSALSSLRLYYLLQEVNEFLHASLMSGSSEDLLLERSLLVQLEQHHQERPRKVRSAYLLQGNSELHPLQLGVIGCSEVLKIFQ